MEQPNSIETEQTLLGTLLTYTDKMYLAVEDGLSEAHFYDKQHQDIFNAMNSLHNDDKRTDADTVTRILIDNKKIKSIGEGYISDLKSNGSTPSYIENYVATIKDKKVERDMLALAQETIRNLKSSMTTQEVQNELGKSAMEITTANNKQSSRKIQDILPEWLEHLQMLQDSDSNITGLETGYGQLDKLTGGLQDGNLIIIGARPSVGKGHPNWLELPTPTGAIKVGDIEVGDYVFDRYGKPTKVTGVFPRGKLETYKVTLSDGRSTIVDGDHIWSHYMTSGCGNESLINKTTEYMYKQGAQTSTKRAKYRIPTNSPVQMEKKKHFIKPYVIGALIGDGALMESRVTLSSGDAEVVEKVAEQLGLIEVPPKYNNYSWTFKDTNGNFLMTKDNLGMFKEMTTYSHLKEIPKEYLYDSYENRMKLLNGLFDTDGSAFRQREKLNVSYSTTSKKLKEQVVWLLNSCGYLTSVILDRRESRRDCYDIRVLGQPRETEKLFTLPRKRKIVESYTRTIRRNYGRIGIESIERTGKVEEITCISVDNKEQLYLANDFIVTHNTAFALNLGKEIADRNKKTTLIFSIETPEVDIIQRIMTTQSGIEGIKLRDGMRLSEREQGNFNESYFEIDEMPIVINDSSVITTNEIFSECRRIKNEQGLGVVIIDYLTLITPLDNKGNEQEQASKISRQLKILARELDVPVIALSQLSRTIEHRDDKRPILSDLRSTGAIEQDADIVGFLYREEYNETDTVEESDKQETELIIRKHRNGALATIRFMFDKRIGKFSSSSYY